jgi:triacylglycerol lipase
MPPRSALARLQQIATLSAAGVAFGWLAWHWRGSPTVAVIGFLAIAFGHSLFLAGEFITLARFAHTDPAPAPAWPMLVRAWIAETLWDLRVFCWRQPFRWRAEPDQLDGAGLVPGRRGVVFIHGFICNRGFWNPWLTRMRSDGHPFIAVNLEPAFASIDDYVPTIDAAVRRIAQATGSAPVLICHSMGGLAARAWLRAAGDRQRVHHIITIATPHRGTRLAEHSWVKNGRQMRPDSCWLRSLEQHGTDGSLFTCWYSNCDNVVFPATAATLPGADNRFIAGAAHVELAFDARVMRESIVKVGDAVGD